MSKSLLLSATSTDDFQEMPGAIRVEITAGLIKTVVKMNNLSKDNELAEASTYWGFATPCVIDEQVADDIASQECVVVDTQDYEDIDDIGGDRGHKLWVGDDYVWFAYYDKHSDARIESAMLTITRFLGLVEQAPSPTKVAA